MNNALQLDTINESLNWLTDGPLDTDNNDNSDSSAVENFDHVSLSDTADYYISAPILSTATNSSTDIGEIYEVAEEVSELSTQEQDLTIYTEDENTDELDVSIAWSEEEIMQTDLSEDMVEEYNTYTYDSHYNTDPTVESSANMEDVVNDSVYSII